ncbi:MAG: low molecular weight phosphotyrosine protein phosphatase [Betaproteobacteria bacterium]|nr:low molecular weight phosphotyrosine protein phosphatase [Betaproteobacteria bacterium]
MKSDRPTVTKVLFVCMGNICRSPTADAIFRHQVKAAGLEQEIVVDSAGTHTYHIGNPPDQRAQSTASNRGYKMHDLRARAVEADDFNHFDYILAMDNDNLSILQRRCPTQFSEKIGLLMQYSQNNDFDKEVADPYYGGQGGFERVLDMVEDACQGLLEHINKKKTSNT